MSGFFMRARLAAVCISMLFGSPLFLSGQVKPKISILNVTTDKARYAPGDPVSISVELETFASLKDVKATVTLEAQGRSVFTEHQALVLSGTGKSTQQLRLRAPNTDFRGYRISIELQDRAGHKIATASGALDVSSTWAKFPRYGYLANYDAGTPATRWINELNSYHLNGLQFYDMQYKHHLPTPPGEQLPASWPDIAGRKIDRDTILAFIREGKTHNMMTMAYNASYAAYPDAFTDGSGVELRWAAWPSASGARSEKTVKSLQMPEGWATPALIYMNQSSPEWQNYIFRRMNQFISKLKFDGWHIDSFGDPEAWSYDGQKIDFFSSFPEFTNAAAKALGRPVVLNTVSGKGEAAMAKTKAEFVYSELWPEDHGSYLSILQAANEIHAANPSSGIIFAAYLHNGLAEKMAKTGEHRNFNLPGVLLADAAIFASGAAHIELGDGDRMLSRPYFPDDNVFLLTAEARKSLHNYYDFLVAEENILRDGVVPSSTTAMLNGVQQSSDAKPGTVWTIARSKGRETILHLINLSSATSNSWRDDEATTPEPKSLQNIEIHLPEISPSSHIGWASPDIDRGAWHTLSPHRDATGKWTVTLPELRYWSVLLVSPNNEFSE